MVRKMRRLRGGVELKLKAGEAITLFNSKVYLYVIHKQFQIYRFESEVCLGGTSGKPRGLDGVMNGSLSRSVC